MFVVQRCSAEPAGGMAHADTAVWHHLGQLGQLPRVGASSDCNDIAGDNSCT